MKPFALAAALGAALGRRGYQAVPGQPPDQQLVLVKDGEDISLNLLRRDSGGRVVVGGGPYAARRGRRTRWALARRVGELPARSAARGPRSTSRTTRPVGRGLPLAGIQAAGTSPACAPPSARSARLAVARSRQRPGAATRRG